MERLRMTGDEITKDHDHETGQERCLLASVFTAWPSVCLKASTSSGVHHAQ